MSAEFLWCITLFALGLDIGGILLLVICRDISSAIIIFALSLLLLLSIYRRVMQG